MIFFYWCPASYFLTLLLYAVLWYRAGKTENNIVLCVLVNGVYHSLLCRLLDVVGKRFARIYPDRVCVSKSTIKRRLHQSEYRGFTTRCKPLVSIKNRKARLEFAKRHLKKPSQFWNNILWTDETKINLYQSDGKRRVWRRKGTAHDPKHTTSSVKHGGGSVMAWACMPVDVLMLIYRWFACIY